MVVSRIWSFHYSKTEARYVVGSMKYGVVCKGRCTACFENSFAGVLGVHGPCGHLWYGLLPPWPHRELVQVSTVPTLGPSATSVAYYSG